MTRHSRFALVLLLLITGFSLAHAEPVPIHDSWSDLRFLIGDWDTEPTKTVKSGHFTLAEDLGGAVLIRRNHAEYEPNPGEEQGVVHDDLMMIYTENGKHRATFMDPEGHVIHYSIVAEQHQATFESDVVPDAPRYKLLYKEEKPGQVLVQFWIQPPGGAYQMYVSGKVKKRS